MLYFDAFIILDEKVTAHTYINCLIKLDHLYQRKLLVPQCGDFMDIVF